MSDEHPPFVDFMPTNRTGIQFQGEDTHVLRKKRISLTNIPVVNDDAVDGHIPLRLSKIMSMFLKLTGLQMEVEVTGKYVKQGPGCRLEIPCKYHVSGQEKAAAWVSKKVNLIIKEHECVVQTKRKSKNSKIMHF